MDAIQKNLLEQVAGLHEIPEGAYNIRANGTTASDSNTTANTGIVFQRRTRPVSTFIIKPGTVQTRVYTFRFF